MHHYEISWGWLALLTLGALLVQGHLINAATTLYLHRCQTHLSIYLRWPIELPLRFVIWFYCAIDTDKWVGVHRAHHYYVDTERDVHSPQNEGVFCAPVPAAPASMTLFQKLFFFCTHGPGVVFNNYSLYVRATHDAALMARWARGPTDWWETHWFGRAIGLGPFLLLPLSQAGLGFWLFGWRGAIAGLALSGLLLVWTVAWGGIVNGIGHSSHERDPRTGDFSRDLPWWLTFFLVGEEAHHAHHDHAASPRLGKVDLGAVYIWILERLGLALRTRSAKPSS